MKCKKCVCEVDDPKEISALEMEMISFWGCPECKKDYAKKFKEQQGKVNPLVGAKPKKELF